MPGAMGWTINSAGVGGATRMDWAPTTAARWQIEMSVDRMLGVFFPESVFPPGVQVKIPWNCPPPPPRP